MKKCKTFKEQLTLHETTKHKFAGSDVTLSMSFNSLVHLSIQLWQFRDRCTGGLTVKEAGLALPFLYLP